MSASPCKYDAQHSGLTANQIKETKTKSHPHPQPPATPSSFPPPSQHTHAAICNSLCTRSTPQRNLWQNESVSTALDGGCVYGKHQRPRGPARAYRIRDREAGPSRRSRRIRLGSPIMWDAHGQDIRLHGRRPRPEASVCTYGKPDRAGSQC